MRGVTVPRVRMELTRNGYEIMHCNGMGRVYMSKWMGIHDDGS